MQATKVAAQGDHLFTAFSYGTRGACQPILLERRPILLAPLWLSVPDEELFAYPKRMNFPARTARQIDRMLRRPKERNE